MINILRTQKYDAKKFADDFGRKPNPLKSVVYIDVLFPDGTTLGLTLKFVASNPSKEQIKKRAIKVLEDHDLIQKS